MDPRPPGRWLALAALAALVALAAAGWATGCSEGRSDARTGRAIAAHARDGLTIDMARLADFDWDRLFVFGPYTAADTVTSELGFEWSGADAVEMHDRFSLLVFVTGGEVARHLLQERSKGDFAFAFRSGGYARSEAVFAVEDTDGWKRYRPAAP